MNYLAHGRDALGGGPLGPWRLAGTALPDWLRVLDRRLRIARDTAERVSAVDDGNGEVRGGGDGAGTGSAAEAPEVAALARGVLMHLDDDRAFHSSDAFSDASKVIAALLRPALRAVPGARPSFIAHVLVEVLLDAELARAEPSRIDRYYSALAALDADDVERAAARLTPAPPHGLAALVRRFVAARFVEDYLDDARMLARVDGTFRRVGQPAVVAALAHSVPACRAVVRTRLTRLLAGA